MFEEEGVKSTNPPGNLPVEPVDMLAGVEKQEPMPDRMPDAVSAGLLRPRSPLADSMPQTMPMAETSSPGKKLFLIFILLVVLGAAAAAVWVFVLPRMKKVETVKMTETPEVQNTEVPAPVVNTVTNVVEIPAPAVTTTQQPAVLTTVADLDQDNLSDDREKEVGTDPNNPDTDKDNLPDGDEVLLWSTDPLNPDTDGDKYPDGTEIKNGYSPTGPGKLFQVGVSSTPAAASSTSGPTTVTP